MPSYIWDSELQTFRPRGEVLAERAREAGRNQSTAVGMPMVIGDSLPGSINGMQSMLDGQRYTSRRAYEQSISRAGCEIIGNDTSWRASPQYDEKAHEADIVADVKKSIEQASSL